MRNFVSTITYTVVNWMRGSVRANYLRISGIAAVALLVMVIAACAAASNDSGGDNMPMGMIIDETTECVAGATTACTFAVGDDFTGEVGGTDDPSDWVKVTLMANTSYSITATPDTTTTTADLHIHIDGTTPDVPADPDIGDDDLYTAATDAPHYIEIGLNVAGGYTLTIAAAPEGEEACNSMDAEADCDGDEVLNADDEFDYDMDKSCTIVATGPGANRDSADLNCDNDNYANAVDACPALADADNTDTDGDTLGNVCDPDDDGDLVLDGDDAFVLNACASTNSDSAHATNSDVLPDDIIDPDASGSDRCTAAEITALIAILVADSADPAICDTRASCTDTDDDGDGTLDTADVDMDNDGLIEIATAAALNNVRNDLDGSHYDTSIDDSAQSNAGCPSGGCNGYELVATIADLSTTHANWVPIGDNTNKFTATFDGNGFGITELAVSSAAGNVGFFGRVGSAGVVRNLHVAGTLTQTDSGNIGGLVGQNEGRISNCSATVTVTGGSMSTVDNIAGLVGYNNGGTIENSSSSGTVTGGAGANDSIGGLTGSLLNMGAIRTSWSDATVNGGVAASSMGGLSSSGDGLITDSYFTGTLTGGSSGEFIGGLSGNSSVINSYATATLSGGGGSDTLGGLIAGTIGETTITASFHTHIGGANFGTRVTAAELQAPTNAAKGIFSAWSTNSWDFGTASQFPALRGYVDSNGDDDNLDMDEQGQIMCGQPGQTGTPQTRATRPECVGALVPLPPTR